MTYEQFRDLWAGRTVKQIEREIESMRRYMQRHNAAYVWHGNAMTAPGSLADGDKLSALREALEIRKATATSDALLAASQPAQQETVPVILEIPDFLRRDK